MPKWGDDMNMSRPSVWACAGEAISSLPRALTRPPVAIGLAALVLLGQDLTQQATGFTAADPIRALTELPFALLLTWKIVALWFLSTCTTRAICPEYSTKLNRAGLAPVLASLLLLIIATVLTQAGPPIIASFRVPLHALFGIRVGKLCVVALLIGWLVGSGIALARLTGPLNTLLMLGRRGLGFASCWRMTRGNGWRLWLGETLIILPLMLPHYVLSAAVMGHRNRFGLVTVDGLLEIGITLIVTLFGVAFTMRLMLNSYDGRSFLGNDI